MSTLYDSVNAADLPADTTLAAGYVDGNYQSYNAIRARFPKATVVGITVRGLAGYQVVDVESGDLTPAQGAAWAQGEVNSGRRPTIYCARGEWNAVISALAAIGVAQAQVDFWIADWTGRPHRLAGSVATQWGHPGGGASGNYDITETDGIWPRQPGQGPGDEPLNEAQKRTWARVAYLCGMGRQPESGPVEVQQADSIADDGGNLENVFQGITDSAEAQQWRQALHDAVSGYAALQAQVTKLQQQVAAQAGGTVFHHTHPVPPTSTQDAVT